MKKTTWNTYYFGGYTYDVANDQASAGGCHYYQIRQTKHGWQHRIRQANGRAQSFGPITVIDDAEGEAKFEQAKKY